MNVCWQVGSQQMPAHSYSLFPVASTPMCLSNTWAGKGAGSKGLIGTDSIPLSLCAAGKSTYGRAKSLPWTGFVTPARPLPLPAQVPSSVPAFTCCGGPVGPLRTVCCNHQHCLPSPSSASSPWTCLWTVMGRSCSMPPCLLWSGQPWGSKQKVRITHRPVEDLADQPERNSAACRGSQDLPILYSIRAVFQQ